MNTLTTWLKSHSKLTAALVGLLWTVATAAITACTGAGTPDPKVAAAENDLCIARADWKVVAAVSGGLLDPKPGSPRAKLEAAEDALCAARAVSPPAGSSPPPSSSVPDAAP
ncbi:MAG TPA: hypothetical protein VGI10_04915 [Polyangiaceae bacterium]|jgi:hypothetical protein